jgi:hypothetical protein
MTTRKARNLSEFVRGLGAVQPPRTRPPPVVTWDGWLGTRLDDLGHRTPALLVPTQSEHGNEVM